MNNDLISRKNLKKAFSENCLHNCYYCKLAKWDKKGTCYNCGLIDNAPPAEPATSNRGKWKQKDGINYYFCNICGSGNNNGGGIKTNFCPNCGAQMETGATDE